MAKLSQTHLALLRGINVGGNNVIPMVELKDCFERAGLLNVQTYIQSGNVLFQSKSKSIKGLTKKIEQTLSERFSYSARAVVLSRQTLLDSVECAHRDWGKRAGYKHNAMFAIDGLDVESVLNQLPPIKKSIDTVSNAETVIFWSANTEKVSQSAMMKIAKSATYKLLTVRNHNTVFKLTELMN